MESSRQKRRGRWVTVETRPIEDEQHRYIQIPEEYKTSEVLGAIMDELERLSTEHFDENTTTHIMH